MAYGFKPVRVAGGAAPTPNCVNSYSIASAFATSIFTGDPIKMTTDGTLILATVGAPIVGIFAGVEYTAANGSVTFSQYWPASTVATNIKAYVYDDPMTVFKVASDQDTTALVAASKAKMPILLQLLVAPPLDSPPTRSTRALRVPDLTLVSKSSVRLKKMILSALLAPLRMSMC